MPLFIMYITDKTLLQMRLGTVRKPTILSAVVICATYTCLVIGGALFATFLLNKLDVLETEVSKIISQ